MTALKPEGTGATRTAPGDDGGAGERGFSLLEVMVALALLAMALVVLVQIATQNVRNTQHARMTTVATFLARAKMADLEDQVTEDGFIENDEEEAGDFSDDKRPEYRWQTTIQKIELPADLAQQTQDIAQDTTEQANENPMAAMAMRKTFLTRSTPGPDRRKSGRARRAR